MFAEAPSIHTLPGGRLRLIHGPIDIVMKAWGEELKVARAYRAAARRFETILPELCGELDILRTPIERGIAPDGPVARRMFDACQRFPGTFVTPMAAVAGSVADELLAALRDAGELDKAFVNNGGDIAVHCAPGHALKIGVAGDFGKEGLPGMNGLVSLDPSSGIGGIATSGRHGRSLSLGIADSVTVLASSAAIADAAATLVANAVDTNHPAIRRRPASDLAPDSDLGDRPVTTEVGVLPPDAIASALNAGLACAAGFRSHGLIADAALTLQGHTAMLTGGKTIATTGRAA